MPELRDPDLARRLEHQVDEAAPFARFVLSATRRSLLRPAAPKARSYPSSNTAFIARTFVNLASVLFNTNVAFKTGRLGMADNSERQHDEDN